MSDEWTVIRCGFQLMFVLIALALGAALVLNYVFCILRVTPAGGGSSEECALLVRLGPADYSENDFVVLEKDQRYCCAKVISSRNGQLYIEDGEEKGQIVPAETVVGRAEMVVIPMKKLGQSPAGV